MTPCNFASRLIYRSRFSHSALLCLLLASTGLQAAPPEFVAQYELYRNGKRLGSSEISAKKTASGFVFQTHSQSEGGWASLLGGAEITEASQFVLRDDHVVATNYSYKQAVSVKKRSRDIQFDWNKNMGYENDGKNRVSYALQPNTLDRHVVVLVIAEDLKNKRTELTYPVAYKGLVEQWRFANKGVESVSTPMGTINATRIDRIRTGSDRTTVSWHAEQYQFLPIRIAQTEPDGETMEMRLKAISIGKN